MEGIAYEESVNCLSPVNEMEPGATGFQSEADFGPSGI
jgi:hypothetical protein